MTAAPHALFRSSDASKRKAEAALAGPAYPAAATIEVADLEQLLRWRRGLRAPAADHAVDREKRRRIMERCDELRRADEAVYAAVSKAVGW